MSDAIEAALGRALEAYESLSGYSKLERLRAALTAYEAAKGGGVGVKPLEWITDEFRSMECAASILGTYSVWEISGTGCYLRPDARAGVLVGTTIEEAKAAAQADYDARIRSALTSPASGERDAPEGYVLVPVEPTAEMLRAGMDDLGWWVEPYEAPRESGVPIDSDMSAEDAAVINAQQIEVVASCYRAMIAAALRMEGK